MQNPQTGATMQGEDETQSRRVDAVVTTKSHIDRVGPYRVEEEIGRGGMATVYKVLDAKDQVYALKLLHHGSQQDPRWGTRFQREFRLLSRLRHPHLIQVYDYGEDNDRAYYVMDYIDGMTLWTFYRDHLADLPVEDRLPWLLPLTGHVVSALDYIHRHRVVHQDLKPANILLERHAETAYLADFGLAKEVKAGTSQFTHVGFVGTLGYAAPEIVERTRMDGRADIYSLGVVLYTLLADRRPIHVEGRSLESLIHAVLHEQPPPLQEIVAGIPLEMAHLIHRCMQKDPNQRYRSTRELWQDLLPLIGTYQKQATMSAPVPTLPQEEIVAPGNVWNESLLIGRQEEFTLSQLRIEQMVQQKQSGAAIFYGIPGIGKSYLLEDLYRVARRHCRHVWTCRLRPQAAPFGSLSELLRSVLAQVEPSRYLSASYQQLACYLPGLPHAEPLSQEALPTMTDPLQDLSKHFHHVLQRCSHPEGQVWLIDDLHCADVASQEVLKRWLLQQMNQADNPWVVLASISYDPGGTSPAFRLPDHPQIDTLHLLPFAEEEEQQLVEQWLGRPLRETEFRQIRHISRGIPLRTYELIHQNHLLQRLQGSEPSSGGLASFPSNPALEEHSTHGLLHTTSGSQTVLDSVPTDLDSISQTRHHPDQANTAIHDGPDSLPRLAARDGFEQIPNLESLPQGEETVLSPLLAELVTSFQNLPMPPEPTKRARLPKKPTFLSWQDMMSEAREVSSDPQKNAGTEQTRAELPPTDPKEMEATIHRQRSPLRLGQTLQGGEQTRAEPHPVAPKDMEKTIHRERSPIAIPDKVLPGEQTRAEPHPMEALAATVQQQLPSKEVSPHETPLPISSWEGGEATVMSLSPLDLLGSGLNPNVPGFSAGPEKTVSHALHLSLLEAQKPGRELDTSHLLLSQEGVTTEQKAVGEDTAIRTTELRSLPDKKDETVALLANQPTNPTLLAIPTRETDEENPLDGQLHHLTPTQGQEMGDVTALQEKPSKVLPSPALAVKLPLPPPPKVPSYFLSENAEDTGIRHNPPSPPAPKRPPQETGGTSETTAITPKSSMERTESTVISRKNNANTLAKTLNVSEDTAISSHKTLAMAENTAISSSAVTENTAISWAKDREEDGPTSFFQSVDLAVALEQKREASQQPSVVSEDPTPARFTESSEELILIPLLQQRLSMLTPQHKNHLVYATFLAETFTVGELSTATAVPQEQILDLLNYALTLRVLEIHKAEGEEQYAFLYPLLRRLLTASLTPEQRKHIATRTALAMSQQRADYHKQHNSSLLAMRYSEAALPVQAVQWQLFSVAQSLAIRIPETQMEALQQLFHLLRYWAQQGTHTVIRAAVPLLLEQLRPDITTLWSKTCEQLVHVGLLHALQCVEEAQEQTAVAQNMLRALMREQAQSDPSSISFLYKHLQPLLQFAHLDFASQRS